MPLDTTFKVKKMGEILCIGVRCKITWSPSLLPHWYIGWTIIPIGPLLQLQYSFLTLQKPIRGPQRSENIFVRHSNMFYLFTEIYQSQDEVILEQYWRVLYSGFKLVSVIIIIRNILEIQKLVQVLG